MSFSDEFLTVKLLTESSAETRGVDAFSLSLIKAEHQLRKLVTHLVFQFPCFSYNDIPVLRDTLAANRGVYFEGMIRGFDAIYPVTVEEIVGQRSTHLKQRISEATRHRNKIFHGQLTNENLGRKDLLTYASDIMEWCQLLSEGAKKELGYDGFERNSFHKSNIADIYNKFNLTLESSDEYRLLIGRSMARQR